MSGPAGAKQSAMCQLVVVVFDRMSKAFIDRGTCWSIAGFITILALGDHTFTNDSQSSYRYPHN